MFFWAPSKYVCRISFQTTDECDGRALLPSRATNTLMPIMWIAQHLAARMLVWLAAMAVPVQGLPTDGCICTSVSSASDKTAPTANNCCASSHASCGRCPCTGAEVCRCGQSSLCHKPSHSCCAGHRAKASCCSDCCGSNGTHGTCPCGEDCQCGKNDTPKTPATPPVEPNSPERIVADSAMAISSAVVYQRSALRQHVDFCMEIDSLAALDRCVILCRFTT